MVEREGECGADKSIILGRTYQKRVLRTKPDHTRNVLRATEILVVLPGNE